MCCVFDNLFINVIWYVGDGGEVMVFVICIFVGSCVYFRFIVLDIGFGVLFEQCVYIFELFVIGCVEGFGFGFVVVSEVVVVYGGWVWLDEIVDIILFVMEVLW